ncbi:MAG: hypothetical protein Q8M95_09050 [Candidatus Methanoperedens sp.]|nr:hypothetical protein [Candidatus Methanoperedens sp.]
MIKVEHISKQYKIGVDRTYKTFQDAITTAVKSRSRISKRAIKKTTPSGRSKTSPLRSKKAKW